MLSFDGYLKFHEDDFLHGQRLDPPSTLQVARGAALRRDRQLTPKARDLGRAIRSERGDKTPLVILVPGEEALLSTLELDHGCRGQATDELEP